MIETDAIRKVVHAYLKRYPGERARLTDLVESIDAGREILSRKTFTGHVTCSAIIIDDDNRVLHVRHRALNMWLRPGGHLEPEDTTLLGAAVREVAEETGINGITALDSMPLDIDVHAIPADDGKGEPEHWHYDLRWLFGVSAEPEVSLQREEVTDHGWLALDLLQPATLRDKLSRFSA